MRVGGGGGGWGGGGRPYHLAKKTISHLQGTAFNCYMARIQRASMC